MQELDLENVKYDRETLKQNIYKYKLIDILKTQTLDMSFIVRYILSDLYRLHEDDKKISMDDVIMYQPHINIEELVDEVFNNNSDDDSVEDFQSYVEKHN